MAQKQKYNNGSFAPHARKHPFAGKRVGFKTNESFIPAETKQLVGMELNRRVLINF